MSSRPAADPHLGRTLGGQYRIDALLGCGGMGRVYRGLQLSVSRPVAIKLIAGAAPYPPEWVERFRREAEATARLSHPNSVRLFDFGVTESEELFMVMELLEGTTLAQHLLEHGPLPLRTALTIARQVLLALCEAHALGITHRDVKPDNIFLAQVHGADIVAKVMDFGIAGLAQTKRGAKLTGTGVVIGTPAYMSPEQAQGRPVYATSDVYSLGVVLFEMLTGRPVFESNTAVTLLLAHVATPPKRLSEVGVQLPQQAGLQSLLDRLLAKEPAARPSAAEALSVVTTLAARLGVADATGAMRAPNAPAAVSSGSAPAALRGSEACADSARERELAAGTGAANAHSLRSATATLRASKPLRSSVFVLGTGLVLAAAAGLLMRWVPVLVHAALPVPAHSESKSALTASQPARRIILRSEPSGASVLRDGDAIGNTPLEVKLDHELTLSVAHEGYLRKLVRVTHDAPHELLVKLVPLEPDPSERPRSAPPPEPRAARPKGAPVDQKPARDEHAPLFFSLRQASTPSIGPAPTPDEPANADERAQEAAEARDDRAARSSAFHRAGPAEPMPMDEAELADVALDDDEQAHVSKHHGLRVIGRVLARAIGRVLIPYPDRDRREALAGMPLSYLSFRAARRAYRNHELDQTGFQEAVWQLRERRRKHIQVERDRFARGELTQEQYEARLDRIWEEFWGRR